MTGTTKSLIEKDSLFKEFCSNRELRESSIKSYINGLSKYSDFTNKSLTELIEEAEDEEEEGIRLRKRKINKYLTSFKTELRESGLNQSTEKHMLMLVKAFYREFDIEIPRSKRRKSNKSRNNETIAELPTMEEIQRFMEHCNSVYKAIVVTGLSSGMGLSELSSLTFKHLFDAISFEQYPETLKELIIRLKANPDTILFWNIKRIKTGNNYFTFSSPESLDRITIYLEELYKKDPDYKPNLEDKLFRSINPNKALAPTAIGATFSYINQSYDYRRVNKRFVVRCHNLRKYFATTLEKNKVPHLTTRWLLGHNTDSLTNAYFKPDPEAIKTDYLKVVNQLTTNNIEIKVINQYEDLNQQIDEIRHNEEKHLEVIESLMEMVNLEFTKLGNVDMTNEEAKGIINEERNKLARNISQIQSKLNGKINSKDKIPNESRY
ncbi:site-specific integrase [uncultured Methanobacterium sp.]|uniref:tyrosine-type recombinase/integrase n=1 Tax=uncultured Methanobacterium sp. TaxID=176306 RepID=UPI002AA6C2F5|nr:site-specific integrase [uncultured Methanobacterium sp.]